MNTAKAPKDIQLSVRSAIVIIVGIGVLAFSNSFWGVFLYDDIPNIVNNPYLRSLQDTWNAAPGTIPGGFWHRPIGRWSFALNYQLSGYETWSYHLLNLIIHLLAGIVLFDLVRRVYSAQIDSDNNNKQQDACWFAFSVALIWIVHPIQTESVTYIVQRLESLMGLFYLCCLYFVVLSHYSKRPQLWNLATLVVCLLGMLTKEVMVTAPFVTLMFDRIFLSSSWSELMKKRGWVYAGMTMVAVYLLWLAFGHRISWLPQPEKLQGKQQIFREKITRYEYLLTQFQVVLHYLRLSFWPAPQSVYYYDWPIAKQFKDVWLSAVIYLGLFLSALGALWYRPKLGFLGITFFLILMPSSSIIPLKVAFEHRMYLSLACLTILFVLGIQYLLAKMTKQNSNRSWMIAILIIVVGPLSITTILRNEVYTSSLAFYQDAALKNPNSVEPFYDLGNTYLKLDDLQNAKQCYQYALKLNPHDARPHAGIGAVLGELNEIESAIFHLEEAVKLEEKFDEAHHRLAVLLEQHTANWIKAEKHFQTALKLSPSDYEIHNDYAVALLSRQKLPQAQAELENALQIKFDSFETHNNLGIVIMMQGGSVEQAIFHFQQALRFNPLSEDAKRNLSRAQQANSP